MVEPHPPAPSPVERGSLNLGVSPPLNRRGGRGVRFYFLL